MPKNVKKIIHICIIVTIIIAIGFTALLFILGYMENGETNLPFEISKITIVSTVDAQNVEDDTNKWNDIVQQNSDIYIDIKKNDNYSKKRIVQSVKIDNFQILKEPLKGNITIYRPSTNEVKTFENIPEYEIQEIVYEGNQKSDMQNLKIANQGGRVAFRCANNNVGNYISNEETELNYNDLLQKLGVTDDDLNTEISFDIEIVLTNGTTFKANIKLDLPAEGVSNSGKSSKEITDYDVVFKR